MTRRTVLLSRRAGFHTCLWADHLLRAAGVGGAGAIWGLGLARLVAEAGFCSLLYESLLAVAGIAVVCSAIALALSLPLRRLRAAVARGTFLTDRDALGLRSVARPSQEFPLIFIFLVLPLLYVVGVVPHPLAGCVLLVGGAVLALFVAWGDRVRWMPPTVLGLAAFGLYLRTLLPSVGQADTFEFQVVAPLLRVAHPTGYPLYVLLGKLFTLLPLGAALSGAEGSVAWRVNLASAVFATVAVLVLYALLLRLTALRQHLGELGLRRAFGPSLRPGAQSNRRAAQRTATASTTASTRGGARGGAQWLPAFLPALAFAFSSTFWSQAIVAEVYTLHNLLVAVILWLLLDTCPRSHPTTHSLPLACRWQTLFFLLGLSLTNHLTTVLLLPAVALALLWDRPRLRPKDWLIAGGSLLLGLSVYLFIPLRWPALNHRECITLREFISYVTGSQFHGALRLHGWCDPVRWGIVGRLLREPFGWIGLGLAIVGIVGLAVRQKRALAMTSVTFLAFILYGLAYYIPDISVFLLPAHLILAVWIGAGIAFLTNLLSQLGHCSSFIVHRSSFIVRCSLFILFALLSLSRVWLNLPLVDQSDNQGGYAWGQYVLSLPLASGSAILADVEKFAPLYYLQQIEGVRPDLDLLLLGSEELYRAQLAARLRMGQTVYLARYLPNLGGLHLRSLGPLVEVGNPVFANRWAADGAGVSFGREVRLLDAEVNADPLGRALYHLTLYWSAETRVSGDFVVRLRLVDTDGQVCWESDGARPVRGLYPTNTWPVGVVVSDYHEVSLPPWLPPGEYVLEVGLFPPFSDAGLEVDSLKAVDHGTMAWLALHMLEVTLPCGSLPPLPRERHYSFTGGEWLTGYNVAGEAPAGAPFVADLSWHRAEMGMAEMGHDVRLAWVDTHGQEVEVTVFPLAAGSLRSHHVIPAPQSPGSYTLHVGLLGEAARCGWLTPPSNGCPLAAVEVVPAQRGLANFADLVLLLGAEVGGATATSTRGGTVRPGGIIPVTLHWRALRVIGEDYTAFVHLIGPDGRLHGQVDAWPVQGSYPTSQWVPSEEVNDPYEVRLDPGAPPGRYRVEVGWYLLATMQRLQIFDTDGRPVGDSFAVGEFTATSTRGGAVGD